ncbi:MAG: type II secretion system protein N [Burkholderiaceae bacterium]
MKMPRLASSTSWGAGLASLLMLALLCGLIVYWGLALASPAVSIAPAGSLVSQSTGLDTGLASTMFGRANGAAPVASAPLPRNIKVVGIAASADRSAVIVSVDGQSAGAYGVGQQIDDSLKVVSVDSAEVVLEHRGETIRVPAPASADLSALNANADGLASGATSANAAGSSPAPAGTRSPPVQALSSPPATRATQQPSNNARAPRRLASTVHTGGARPPLPPRTLPPAGAAAAAPRERLSAPPPPPNQPVAANSDPSQPQTALGRALQQMERSPPVVRQ